MKKRNIILVISIVVVIIAAGYFTIFSKSLSCSPVTARKIPSGQDLVITYQDNKFTPDCTLVSPGTKIQWINKGRDAIEIGADPHPIHTGNKEISDDQFVLTLKPEESKTAIIKKPGKSGYHNHLYPLAKGMIIVQ